MRVFWENDTLFQTSELYLLFHSILEMLKSRPCPAALPYLVLVREYHPPQPLSVLGSTSM